VIYVCNDGDVVGFTIILIKRPRPLTLKIKYNGQIKVDFEQRLLV